MTLAHDRTCFCAWIRKSTVFALLISFLLRRSVALLVIFLFSIWQGGATMDLLARSRSTWVTPENQVKNSISIFDAKIRQRKQRKSGQNSLFTGSFFLPFPVSITKRSSFFTSVISPPCKISSDLFLSNASSISF